jgi:hypothetical protein
MSTELFATALLLTLGTVGAALLYLRGTTRRVLQALCLSDEAADFWLRSADVLALAGSLILVLVFGGLLPEQDWIAQLRLILALALGGVFIAVVLVSSSVWRTVPARADAAMSKPTPVPHRGEAHAPEAV